MSEYTHNVGVIRKCIPDGGTDIGTNGDRLTGQEVVAQLRRRTGVHLLLARQHLRRLGLLRKV